MSVLDRLVFDISYGLELPNQSDQLYNNQRTEVAKASSAPIRAQLDSLCEFVFLDGEVECAAAPGRSSSGACLYDTTMNMADKDLCLLGPGISSIFPGPSLCYFPAMPSQSDLLAAHSLVASVLEEEGPFEGLLGFSQGAALCANILLQASIKIRMPKSPPVQCAFFICGILPWTLGQAPSMGATRAIKPNFQGDSDRDDAGNSTSVAVAKAEMHGSFDESALSLDLCTCIDPSTSPVRISIPTAHIVGGPKDPYFSDSQALAKLGDEERGGVRLFNHGQGHIVPRGAEASKRMGDAILWTMNRVRFRH